jgi:prevent-host-death family protein
VSPAAELAPLVDRGDGEDRASTDRGESDTLNTLIDVLEIEMERRIDAHVARTQFGQIMDRAVENNERFVVERRGEPAVVIMSVQDFIRTTAPPPDWLQKAWSGAKRRGLDKLTSKAIDAEIAAYRREKKHPPRPQAK